MSCTCLPDGYAPVPGPCDDSRVLRAQVNKIRESLGRVVRNSTAAGLRQPHLERTRLCELSDAELDPVYVRQRDALRDTVRELAHPKSVNGQVRCSSLVCPYPVSNLLLAPV